MSKNLAIKSWALDDRPREKLILKGKNALSDAELIAILLSSGSKDKSALELAKELLSSSSNNLTKFAKLTIKDLMKFKGVGEVKAITILAALELGKRRKFDETPERVKITKSNDVFLFFKDVFQDLQHEECHLLLLNRANEIIHTQQISKGGVAGTVVDGKLVYKIALDYLASALILCHNHPSGQLKPSAEDIELTHKLKYFGKMIDLPLLDHIIFADNGYFSFADSGLMIN